MKKYFILLAVVTFLMSCGKVEKPTVATLGVMQITETSAMCSGNVESDGGAEVTAKGVCWAKSQNPTIENDYTNDGTGVGNFTSNIHNLDPNTQYYVRAYATNEAGIAYGEEKSFTTLEVTPEEPGDEPEEPGDEPEIPEEPGDEPEEPEMPIVPEEPEQDINGYPYVDLGLPSGVKWATRNVGAFEPQEVGTYFAWGEIKSKEMFSQEECSTYYKEMGDISGDANYDVAAYAWGSTWRMPTEAEVIELRDNCTFEWVMLNVYMQGCIVTGPNGNQIYLPSGGFKTNQSVDFADAEAAYWTSTPDTSNGDLGYATFFYAYNNNFCNRGWMSRYVGLLVRPVSE